MAKALTHISVENLKPAPTRREVPDGKIAGLYLVLQPSGARSWAVRYRVDGTPKKLTIGPYPAVDLAAARRRAQEAIGDVAAGKDPAAVKRAGREARKAAEAPSDRVEAVAASFLEKYVKRKVGAVWAREAERLFRVEIVPRLGVRRLGEIKKSDIHDLLDGIVERGSPITANCTLAIFRRLCNWSVERGIIAISPCTAIKPPAPERSRDRVLDDDEKRLAWRAFEQVSWPFGPIAQLLLLTGARRDEVAEARWNEFDLDSKTWTIPKERSKNGNAHEIPLSGAAIRILTTLPKIGDRKGALVFSTTGRTSVSGFSRAKTLIDTAIAEARGEDVGPMAPWVFHDLRRSAASGMACLGIAPHVVEAVLNHKSGSIKGVAAVYNRYNYGAEKRAALEAWAARLDAIVSGDAIVGGADRSNVVPLATARGR